MYRFSIDSGDWIFKFSPHLQVEKQEREAILKSLLKIGSSINHFSHGDSFVIFMKDHGMVVFRVEKIPSLIVTVSTIITKDKWFVQKGASVQKFTQNINF